MGTYDVITVSTPFRKDADHINGVATRLGLACVTALSPINDVWNVVVMPDGSKEGWPESYAGDLARARFMLKLDTGPWSVRWAAVTYGECGVRVRHHDKNTRARASLRRAVKCVTEIVAEYNEWQAQQPTAVYVLDPGKLVKYFPRHTASALSRACQIMNTRDGAPLEEWRIAKALGRAGMVNEWG